LRGFARVKFGCMYRDYGLEDTYCTARAILAKRSVESCVHVIVSRSSVCFNRRAHRSLVVSVLEKAAPKIFMVMTSSASSKTCTRFRVSWPP